MHTIIVGCGRVGSRLATLFHRAGFDVAVIDIKRSAFANLERDFEGKIVVGLGYDEGVLLEAGVEECDALLAVTNIDNTNLMITEVSKRLFDVPHILTRLVNPTRENAYLQLGFDYVCGTNLISEEMYSKVIAGNSNHIDTLGDYEVLRFSLDLKSHGLPSVRVADIERRHSVRIAAFERKDGSDSSIPTPESLLYDGDIILAAVRKDVLGKLRDYMN
ncbi:MAG: TrkA family potassium uptake protein [Coriobacteriales bacterium]|jgi:trk system potassium uptake protein TrkA|nr:TrkA family potassium uptake protein [Coriobacteriales bacterium]